MVDSEEELAASAATAAAAGARKDERESVSIEGLDSTLPTLTPLPLPPLIGPPCCRSCRARRASLSVWATLSW